MGWIQRGALLAACSLLSPSVQAIPITIEFDDGPFHSKPLPYSEDGFTFVESDGPAVLIAHLATNNIALRLFPFGDEQFGGDNGATEVQMSRDGGGTFDLLSFDTLTGFIEGSLSVVSSKGGVHNILDDESTLMPVGDEWQGITSLTFLWEGFPTDTQASMDFDNIVIASVPEPGTVTLICGGLIGLVVTVRRRRQLTSQ